MIDIVPTTAAHVRELYGRDLPMTIYGVSALDDDKVLGMGALLLTEGCMIAVCKVSEEARADIRRHRRAFIVGWRKLLAIAKARGLTVRAVPQEHIVGARSMLRHFGFHEIENGVWECQN